MSLPSLSAAGGGMVVSVTLAESTRFLAGGGEASGFSVLVHGVDNPVDSGVSSDSLVRGVNKDDLEVLVCRVLVDPV